MTDAFSPWRFTSSMQAGKKNKPRFGLQALLMLGSYLLAVCHCASSIWRPTQHSGTLHWKCFEMLLESSCSRKSSKQKRSKTSQTWKQNIQNTVQHTGWFGHKDDFCRIQSTLSFALNPSGPLLLNLLYTSPFCCPWPNQWSVHKTSLEKRTENLWLQMPSGISISLLAPAAWSQHG